jgi:hypothetical protein
MQAFRLKQDYEKGKLKGKLKKITENLNEDDNPIIMILKFKE